MAKAAAPKAKTNTRNYVVVRVEGDELTVLDPQRQAKSAGDAMDQVAANMRPEDRNGCLGAFLAGSYREQEFKSEQAWTTTKVAREPSFHLPVRHEPAPPAQTGPGAGADS